MEISAKNGARFCIPGFHTTTHLATTAYYLPWGSAQEALVNTRGSKTILCEGNYSDIFSRQIINIFLRQNAIMCQMFEKQNAELSAVKQRQRDGG
jgi:hypothetical protein